MDNRVVKEIVGVVCVAVAAFIFLSLYAYNKNPEAVAVIKAGQQAVDTFAAGPAGIFVTKVLATSLGSASFFLAFLLIFIGWFLIRDKALESNIAASMAIAILIPSIATFLHLTMEEDPFFKHGFQAGGLVGYFIASFFSENFGVPGSYLILTTLIFISFMLFTKLSLTATIDSLKDASKTGYEVGRGYILEKKRIRAVKQAEAERKEKIRKISGHVSEDLIVNPKEKAPEKGEEEAKEKMSLKDLRELKIFPRQRKKPIEVVQNEFEFVNEIGEYKLPPMKLMDDPVEPPVSSENQKKMLMNNAVLLEKKLLDFGVEGKVVQILPGPVITMYEFEPAPGVKVSRVTSLSDDLALGMRAMSIRVLAPIPGKNVIGIEIPNEVREPIALKEILIDEIFQKMESKLTISLGKDIYGNPMVVDLAQIPHLLIAGTTGSGKSVGLNGMITSILYKARPDEVKFIMIDPKMIELSVYDGIPHLITPVVTNPKKAASALRWAVMEMERRYELLSAKNVRHISTYNELMQKEIAKNEKSKNKEEVDVHFDEEGNEIVPLGPTTLPYIVVVIDELADLMMICGKEVEESLARLAQKARAAGIHLLLATQRPSVDVLTGVIKANFPSRISFKVFSRTDSRTVLDSMGAEKLLGRGDMLFLAPGTSEISRVHGGYISEKEILSIVNFIKSQQKPNYIEEVLNFSEPEGGAGGNGDFSDDEKDEKYEEAIEFVAESGQASISMLQRRLRVGYNRAARMIEIMERDGIVGPSDGVKPREVLIRND